MRVISYNIQYGRGRDGVIDLVRSCNAIRGADIICLQEVDQHWQRSGDLDQAAEISGLLPSYYAVYGSSFDVDASADHEDRSARALLAGALAQDEHGRVLISSQEQRALDTVLLQHEGKLLSVEQAPSVVGALLVQALKGSQWLGGIRPSHGLISGIYRGRTVREERKRSRVAR